MLVPLCVFQSWTGAYHKLTPILPQESLFNFPVLLSVLGSALIQLIFQLYMSFTLEDDLGASNYIECVESTDFDLDDPPCSTNTLLYLLTTMQYITCCLVFSISKPFRKPVYTNPLYLVSVSLMAAYGFYLIFYVDSWSEDYLGLTQLPSAYKWKLLIAVLLNSLVSYIFEKFVISWVALRYDSRRADHAARQRVDIVNSFMQQAQEQEPPAVRKASIETGRTQ